MGKGYILRAYVQRRYVSEYVIESRARCLFVPHRSILEIRSVVQMFLYKEIQFDALIRIKNPGILEFDNGALKLVKKFQRGTPELQSLTTSPRLNIIISNLVDNFKVKFHNFHAS